MLHAVIIDSEPRPLDPPDLLARLAVRGVRLLDPRRHLLLDAPVDLLTAEEWPELEGAVRRSGSALQNLAVLVAMTRADTAPEQLVERMLALPAACLPVLIEALGGADRLERLASDVGSEAQLDLCFAAYLQALGYQVAHGLGEDDEEDGEPGDGPRGYGSDGAAGLLAAPGPC